jgi:hypothetical protein
MARKKEWDIDWGEFDRLQNAGVSERTIAKQMNIPLATFQRRRRERVGLHERNGHAGDHQDHQADDGNVRTETFYRQIAVGLVQRFMAAQALDQNLLTAEYLGKYLPILRECDQALKFILANGESEDQMRAAAAAHWWTIGQDRRYAALAQAVDKTILGKAAEDHAVGEPPPDASAEESAEPAADTERASQATKLVKLAAGVELFHNPDREGYGTITNGQHKETWMLDSKGFKDWLKYQFLLKHDKVANAQSVKDAIGTLEGKAVNHGKEHQIHTRIAEHDGHLYIDLANDDWQAIDIDAHDWRVIGNPPVKFRRTKGMLPLPKPERGGDINDLAPFINLSDEVAGWRLLVSWIVGAFHPTGPYPVLIFHGEQGTAKSTACKVIRALIDPSTTPLRTEPRENRDLMIAATNGWVIALDNVSHLPPWMSDSICRLATGGGFGTRQLYENRDEILFNATRPVLMNGIEEIAVRGDLLDRSILLYLEPIQSNERKPERKFWQEFTMAHPRLLGVLLDAVVVALRDVDLIELPELPRMADFMLWSAAAAPQLGWEAKDFVDAYNGNRDSANDLSLEASLIAGYVKWQAAIGRTMERGCYTGTAKELLDSFNFKASDREKRQNAWPKNERSLSNQLRRIAPNLRAVGIDIEFYREPGGKDGARQRKIRLIDNRKE